MSHYSPDGFVIIKHEGTYYVFGGFNGGYAGSDYWRRNSGIVKVEKAGDYYLLHGHSGSTYAVHPDTEDKLHSYSVCVLLALLKANEGSEQIPFKQFLEEFEHDY